MRWHSIAGFHAVTTNGVRNLYKAPPWTKLRYTMKTATTALPSFKLPFVSFALAFACSPDGSDPSGSGSHHGMFSGGSPGSGSTTGSGGLGSDVAAGTGGAPSGGAEGSGGASLPGSGGQDNGGPTGSGGQVGSGGGSTEPFVCPPGFEGAVPTLGGNTSLVATAPAMGNDSSFLEGPVWIAGNLYMSQIRNYGPQPPARILKLNGATIEPFIENTGTNGLAVDINNNIIAASHKDFGITKYPLAANAAGSNVVNMYQNAGFNSPNDLVLRSDNNIYFTDPNYQCRDPEQQPDGTGGGFGQGEIGLNCPQGYMNSRVYRLSPDGVVTTIASQHTQPNGIQLSPDQNTLYIAGSDAVEKFPVMADGSVGERSVFAEITSVDGMAVDCGGNLYLSRVEGRLDVFSPAGVQLGSIQANGQVTNAAFGGPNHQTLYVTFYGKTELHSIELDIPGYPY